MARSAEHTGRSAVVTNPTTGDRVVAQEVVEKDNAFGSKALLTAATGGIGALSFLAGPDTKTSYETPHGRLVECSEPTFVKKA